MEHLDKGLCPGRGTAIVFLVLVVGLAGCPDGGSGNGGTEPDPATVDEDPTNETTTNEAPTAVSGSDRLVPVPARVALDGGASSDPDGDKLTYSWVLNEVPVGSAAALSDPASAAPVFVADLQGEYGLELIVNDGRADSAPSALGVRAVDDRMAGYTASDFDEGGEVTRSVFFAGDMSAAGADGIWFTQDDMPQSYNAIESDADGLGSRTIGYLGPGVQDLFAQVTMETGSRRMMPSEVLRPMPMMIMAISWSNSIQPIPAPTDTG